MIKPVQDVSKEIAEAIIAYRDKHPNSWDFRDVIVNKAIYCLEGVESYEELFEAFPYCWMLYMYSVAETDEDIMKCTYESAVLVLQTSLDAISREDLAQIESRLPKYDVDEKPVRPLFIGIDKQINYERIGDNSLIDILDI